MQVNVGQQCGYALHDIARECDVIRRVRFTCHCMWRSSILGYASECQSMKKRHAFPWICLHDTASACRSILVCNSLEEQYRESTLHRNPSLSLSRKSQRIKNNHSLRQNGQLDPFCLRFQICSISSACLKQPLQI